MLLSFTLQSETALQTSKQLDGALLNMIPSSPSIEHPNACFL
jgi:hypothetical protein